MSSGDRTGQAWPPAWDTQDGNTIIICIHIYMHSPFALAGQVWCLLLLWHYISATCSAACRVNMTFWHIQIYPLEQVEPTRECVDIVGSVCKTTRLDWYAVWTRLPCVELNGITPRKLTTGLSRWALSVSGIMTFFFFFFFLQHFISLLTLKAIC